MRFLFPFLFVCLVARSARADVVVLRSGVRYSNVKAVPMANSHRVQFPNGRVQTINNFEIQSVRPGPVTWSAPVHAGDHRSEVVTTRPVVPPRVVPPAQVSEQKPAPAPAARDELSPVRKSALLPGWGQYAQKRPGASVLFALGTLLTFQNYWTIRQKHAAAERDYNDPIPVGLVAAQTLTGSLGVLQAFTINIAYLSNKERVVFERQNQGNLMFGALVSIWLWNVFDVIYHSPHWHEQGRLPGAGSEAPDFRLTIGADAFKVSLSFVL